MGFFGKLGNVAEDWASFAVPAATTVGLSAILGPAGAPTASTIMAALGAGARGFAGNEQEERLRKQQLQQNKNNSMANLINQLSSRPSYQAKQAAMPSPGLLEQGARGGALGLDLAAAAQARGAQERLQEQQGRLMDLQIGAAEDAASRRAGEAAFATQNNAQEALNQAVREGSGGTIRARPVQISGITTPGRGGVVPEIQSNISPQGMASIDQARDRANALGNIGSNLTGPAAAGFQDAKDASDRNRLSQTMQVEELDLAKQSARSLDQYRQRTLENDRIKDQMTAAAKLVGSQMDLDKMRTADENTLRGDFTQLNKSFEEVRDSWQRIQSVDAESPMGQISLVFGIMKMNDPESTVRESEYATAENAAGVPVRLRNLFNRVQDGERLAPEQVADIRSQAEALYNAQLQSYDNSVNQFKDIAERRQLDWRNIIIGGPTEVPSATPEEPPPSGEPTGFTPEDIRNLGLSYQIQIGSQPQAAGSSSTYSSSPNTLNTLRLIGSSYPLRPQQQNGFF